MKERLKIIRQSLKLNQDEFARSLGVGRSTIANYEAGTREPVSSVIALICERFNVNEQWLRTGEGDMYVATRKDDDMERMIAAMINDENADRKQRLVTAILRLSPGQIETATDWIKSALGLTDDATAADRGKSAAVTQEEPKPFEEMTIDEKVEVYRKELEAEEQAKKMGGEVTA